MWHNKLAFLEVGNGDYFAFDLNEEGTYPIVYLSHDDGEGHGYIIAKNFIELIDNWSRICFVGSEDWQWLPFVQSSESGILPDSDSAIKGGGQRKQEEKILDCFYYSDFGCYCEL
ncbi:hypothetical protein D3C81_1879570 [compost metagenome]